MTLWIFTCPKRPGWIPVECFGLTQDELFDKLKKNYGRDRAAARAMGLHPTPFKLVPAAHDQCPWVPVNAMGRVEIAQ